jgi:hypothetical protein
MVGAAADATIGCATGAADGETGVALGAGGVGVSAGAAIGDAGRAADKELPLAGTA